METEKGHPGVESAVQRPWHSTPTHKPPVRRWSAAAFFAIFSLPSAYCHVPILSGLPTLTMCPYRLGAWVALDSLHSMYLILVLYIHSFRGWEAICESLHQ